VRLQLARATQRLLVADEEEAEPGDEEEPCGIVWPISRDEHLSSMRLYLCIAHWSYGAKLNFVSDIHAFMVALKQSSPRPRSSWTGAPMLRWMPPPAERAQPMASLAVAQFAQPHASPPASSAASLAQFLVQLTSAKTSWLPLIEPARAN